jgi:hypothetical protein
MKSENKREHPRIVVLRQLANYARIMRRTCRAEIAREAAQLEDQYEKEIAELKAGYQPASS